MKGPHYQLQCWAITKHNLEIAVPLQYLSYGLGQESSSELFILQGAYRLLARHTGHCQKEKPTGDSIIVNQQSQPKPQRVQTESDKSHCWELVT